jgi:hypothetical protein
MRLTHELDARMGEFGRLGCTLDTRCSGSAVSRAKATNPIDEAADVLRAEDHREASHAAPVDLDLRDRPRIAGDHEPHLGRTGGEVVNSLRDDLYTVRPGKPG